MAKRDDVLFAIAALVARALPAAEVIGLDGAAAPAGRVPPGGRIVVGSGDPGEAEVDLGPLAYHYDHRVPIEMLMLPAAGLPGERVVSTALAAIEAEIETDRTLGGLCDWIEAVAPTTGDAHAEGAGRPPRGALFDIVASYSTDSPI